MLMRCRVHTTLPTGDLARARAFYEDTLGIPPRAELPSGVFYDCGEGTRFVLSATAGRPSGAHTQMAFVVEDIENEVEELKSRGVVFEDYDLPALKTVKSIFHGPALKAAWFKDTDGNVLAIMQPVEPLI